MQFGTIRYRHGFQNYPILVFWQCNPVNLHPNLASTQHTFAKNVLSLLTTCEDMGNSLFEDSDIVSKNKLALFSTPQTKKRSRSKEQVASLKTNCTLFSRFYIACQARQSNFDSFFEHENQACPPSTSKYSSWDRCQVLGRGCNCALWSGPRLVEHLRSRPIPSKCFFRISPLGLKLSAE